MNRHAYTRVRTNVSSRHIRAALKRNTPYFQTQSYYARTVEYHNINVISL